MGIIKVQVLILIFVTVGHRGHNFMVAVSTPQQEEVTVVGVTIFAHPEEGFLRMPVTSGEGSVSGVGSAGTRAGPVLRKEAVATTVQQ
jgi:hypothetical protein